MRCAPVGGWKSLTVQLAGCSRLEVLGYWVRMLDALTSHPRRLFVGRECALDRISVHPSSRTRRATKLRYVPESCPPRIRTWNLPDQNRAQLPVVLVGI